MDFGSPPQTPSNSLLGQDGTSALERLIPAQHRDAGAWDNTTQATQTFSHEGNRRQRTGSPFDGYASGLTPERQRAHPDDADHQTEELSPSERKRLQRLIRKETEHLRRLMLEARNRAFMERQRQFQPPRPAPETQVEQRDPPNIAPTQPTPHYEDIRDAFLPPYDGSIASQKLWAQRNEQAKMDAANAAKIARQAAADAAKIARLATPKAAAASCRAREDPIGLRPRVNSKTAANWRDEPDPRKLRNLQLLHGKRERMKRRLAAAEEAERAMVAAGLGL